MAKKSKSALSKLAGRILEGARATQQDIMDLASSVAGGGRKKRKSKKKKSAKKTKAKKRK